MIDQKLHILILVENLPSPFDRRVWQEATTLRQNGYLVSIICPTGKGYNKLFECIDKIDIYRYRLPIEAHGIFGYFLEYTFALWNMLIISTKVHRRHRFQIIHACNPPDLLFLVALPYCLFYGTKFVFDHHDVNPELYEAKFGKKGFFWHILVLLERLTFRLAKIVISTNESYRRIAIERGGVDPDRVHIVRSGPQTKRLTIKPPVESYKNGRQHLVGYVGVMGRQEGIDLLLSSVAHIVKVMGRKDIQFCLVGGGTSLNEMMDLSKQLELTNFVTFTGRVSDSTLLDVLNTSDVCVNPDIVNRMNDISTMNKIMEYMALAKPIVQYNLTEGRFSAQNASLYALENDPIDFAVKVVSLIDDPEKRLKMGQYGYERVINELEWKFEEPKLLKAYSQVSLEINS
ncbi:glycosyltransferase WbuB [Thiocapsa imhoffii]|uniref:Glycosyltransferase WbuB n=1 Tax=Thiocapsa imhoffii TaxID=382777 RepID=A0A9X0WIQ5_9GAMM|nr:glycosyltransferase family 4 protein [Thiocapsa imhoffii]MBK1644857.1 glycosyltransferase WbuB [Thiocapsa imhoffii]